MLRKITTIAAVLVLLTLLAAPLVLAQVTQNTQPSSSQPATPTRPPATLPALDNPYSFDADGNIVIDCGVAFSNFARLELVSDQFAEDPQFQSELGQAQNLSQICVSEGYDPTGGSGSQPSNGTNQYQPSA